MQSKLLLLFMILIAGHSATPQTSLSYKHIAVGNTSNQLSGSSSLQYDGGALTMVSANDNFITFSNQAGTSYIQSTVAGDFVWWTPSGSLSRKMILSNTGQLRIGPNYANGTDMGSDFKLQVEGGGYFTGSGRFNQSIIIQHPGSFRTNLTFAGYGSLGLTENDARFYVGQGVVSNMANNAFRDLVASNSEGKQVWMLMSYDKISFHYNTATSGTAFSNTINELISINKAGNTLEVSGSVKLGSLATDPVGSNGVIVFNSTTNQFRGYRNGQWKNFLMEGDASGLASNWSLVGNSGINPASTFIGTTDAQPVVVKTNGLERVRVSADGKVVIGGASFGNGDYKLYVESGIRTRKIRVDVSSWADYVFDAGYPLLNIMELEKFVKANRHLPDVPSQTEIRHSGLDLAEGQEMLLKKIEELTLYVIDLQKQLLRQKRQIEQLEKSK